MMKKSVFFFVVLVCVSCQFSAPRNDETFPRHIPKDIARNVLSEKLPHPQFPVPPDFTELPFHETAPVPTPLPEELERGYILFTRPITEIVYPNSRPLPSERLRRLFGFASQDEFEALNLCIYPLRQIKKMRIVTTSLENIENGSVIPAENIDVRLLTYWNIRYPSYQVACRTYRRMPELLERVTACDAPVGECLRYWITVKTPSSCVAGLYRGELRIEDNGFDKAVVVPIEFRVFGFSLQKDPAKHFSAYTSIDLFQKSSTASSQQEKEFWQKAARTEYATMRDYGFDTAPTLRIEYDAVADKLRFPANGIEVDEIMRQELGRLIPILMDGVTQALYTKHIGPSKFKKWKVPTFPPPAFFEHMSRLVKAFDDERRAKGWPEFIYNPADEIDSQATEFGARCYKALKDVGVRTFITKDPVTRVAEANAYKKYIDIWCSQPFSTDFESIRKTGKEFWCYPNLISGEIRKPELMCQGGRMTYGFGFWKSGYSMLIPWAWRWSQKPIFDINYLRPDRSSADGNIICENGELIPAVYWTCFREGYDDGRYLYTLQLIASQREGSNDKDCEDKVAEAKHLLRDIWDSFHAQKLYDDKNSFANEDFSTLRWKMAELIEGLLRFPVGKLAPSKVPSVLDCCVTDGKTVVEKVPTSPIGMPMATEQNYETSTLSFDSNETWKALTKESSVASAYDESLGKKTLRFSVLVDHASDGEFEKGAYPMGWPRCGVDFIRERDFSGYDGLSFNIKINSNRDEVDDDNSSLILDVITGKGKKLISEELLGSQPEGVWVSVRCPFARTANPSSPVLSEDLRQIKTMRLMASENYYPNTISISFQIDGPYLYRIVKPFLRVSHPRFLLNVKDASIPIEIEAIGLSGEKPMRLEARISNSDGKQIHTQEFLIIDQEPGKRHLVLPELAEGLYQIAFYHDAELKYISSIRVFNFRARNTK